MLSILSSVWRWRRLVWELARRDFKARYAGSALGVAWAVLEPLVQFALYLTVFSYFLGMRLEGRPGVGLFGVYLISGLVPFLAFQESVVRATGLARERAQLVRHVNVPLEVVLAGALTAVLARHGVALVLVMGVAAAFGTFAPAGVPWLLAGLVVLVIAVFGLGLALMVGGAFLPDLTQVVGTVTTHSLLRHPDRVPRHRSTPEGGGVVDAQPALGRAALLSRRAPRRAAGGQFLCSCRFERVSRIRSRCSGVQAASAPGARPLVDV